LTGPEDVGDYSIEVIATLTSANFTERYKKTFILTVYDDGSYSEKD